MKARVLVTMGFGLHGYTITEHHGIVQGVAVYSPIAGAFRGIGAGFEGFADVAEEALSRALSKMVQHAKEVGANGVITMKYNIIELTSPQIFQVVAYGTGVTVVPATPLSHGKQRK